MSSRRRTQRSFLLLSSVACAIAGSAWGQVTTWNGGSGTWSVSGSWSNGVPGASGTALVDSGNAAASNVNVAADASVATLNVSAGDVVRVTAGTLTVSQRTVNAGTLLADGGTLALQGSATFSDNTGGHIRAGSSDVLMNSWSMAFGTFTSSGAGVVRVASGFNFLRDFTNTGNLTVDAAGRFTPIDTVTNHGSINLNGNTDLSFIGTTFNGSGVVTVNGTEVRATVAVGTLNNNSTIQGFGRVGNSVTNLFNTGTIVANVPGQALGALAAGTDSETTITFQNSGTLMAAGGTLHIGQGGEFVRMNNAGGRIIANGSDVNIRGRITGGTLSSAGGGVIRVNTNALYLNGVTNDGDVTVVSGGVLGLSGVVTNNGSINLTGGPTFASLDMSAGSATLVGPGVVNVDSTPIRAVAAVGTLINQSTIHGGGFNGSVGGTSLSFTNNSVVDANSGTLDLYGGVSFVNNGVLRVSGGAGMRLRSDSGGALLINNGSIDIAGTGTFQVAPGASVVGGTAVVAGTLQLTGLSTGGSPAIGTLTSFRGTGRVSVLANSQLNIAAGGGDAGTSKMGSFDLGTVGVGRINVNDHDLIVDYTGGSPLAQVQQSIKLAYHDGAWDLNGITSALATAAAASSTRTAVGYAESTQLGSPATFGGLPVDSTSVLMRYTLSGDANLDRAVNISDFSVLATNFNSTTSVWTLGDFNYDGSTNIGDFSLLASNFNKQLAIDAPRGSAVPEPCTVGALWAIAAAGRRARRS